MSDTLKGEGIVATPQQCASKYRYLLSTFKEKNDKRSGDAAESWVYMDIMNEINGCKANVNPKHLVDGGSLPGTSSSSNNSFSSDSSFTSADKQTKNPRKRKANNEVLDYLREESEGKERRHHDRLALTNRLLDILERKL